MGDLGILRYTSSENPMFEPHLSSQFSGYPDQDFYGIILPGLGLPIAGGIWGAKRAYDWATGDDEDQTLAAAPQVGDQTREVAELDRFEERALAERWAEAGAGLEAQAAPGFPWRTAAMAAGGLAVGVLVLSLVFRD